MKNILFALLWLVPCAVFAQDAATSFETLNKAVRANDATTSRGYLTEDSQELFGRFTAYNLLGCLPKDAAYQSRKSAGKYQVVNATLTDLSNKKREVRLVFAEEKSIWKMDIPLTLRLGIGEAWQKRVHNAEQIYLLLKAQMGNKLTCSTIKEFVKG